MSKRKTLSKKIRFEVFKRDSFTCQYCGRKAPDVVLEVDHIKPVAKGGTNDIMNLVTSCYDCNHGKRDKTLSDNSTIEKQRNELERLQERNEQLEMMLKWKNELMDIEDKEAEAIFVIFQRETGYGFNDNGKRRIKSLIKKYGLEEIIECANLSIQNYYHTEDDWQTAFDKVENIAKCRAKTKEDPSLLYKNRLCKYFIKKFGDRSAYTFRNLVNRLDVDEIIQEEIFSEMRNTNYYQNVLDFVEEHVNIQEDYEDYKRWCEANGNQTNS